ncbi:MAG TPA: cellulase family glycosylhydrolase [Bacillota bacterium]|mgnify:FL=1|nr:cellulase family glycosylhydrolase [Bacillota bacterium]HPZ91083.1 cellulase family glycosylhydrolase [Bacillota bacterium]
MLKPNGLQFSDREGRMVLLRGVNLGGSTKNPFTPYMPSHVREGFFQHRQVSFVGRPFPLEEADEHYARLKAWGFNCLRFLITWEAIEHAGPGIYDQEYLDFLYEVVAKAGEYGFYVFIDPHQDVWSRFSGGDGAPGWTLEVAGLDMEGFQATGAAIVHNTHGDPFPRMIWPTNYAKLAAATMFTLFFAGNTFAPKTRVEGVPIQDYLQTHYFEAVKKVAAKLKGLPHVLGYDTLNEPSPGWIGWRDLRQHQSLARMGATPTPWQAMQLGEGLPQEVEVWHIGLTGIRRRGKQLVDPRGRRAWLPGHQCVWRNHGVWEITADGRAVLHQPHYFAQVGGRAVDFARDFMKPFIVEFARQIRTVDPDATIFMEFADMDKPTVWTREDGDNMVYAPHWYEPVTLVLKRYIPGVTFDQEKEKIVLGRRRVLRQMIKELHRFQQQAKQVLGGMPTLIGETGIAMDMHKGRAYKTGDFRIQIAAMDRLMRALDANFHNFTLWNYTADNSNERGDGWNGEDLSIFSRDQQTDPNDINSGGRALEAVVRPWPRRIAGRPLSIRFKLKTREFTFSFQPDPAIAAPTEIFVPSYQYPEGYEIRISAGSFSIDSAQQLILWYGDASYKKNTIKIAPRTKRTR